MNHTDLVSGWMTDGPVTVTGDRPVIEVYALMAQYGIRHVPVVDARGRLVGIVSDRDLQRAAPIRKARSAGDVGHLFATRVAEIMTGEPLLAIGPMVTVPEAARKLAMAKVSCLPILDGETLVGIVTTHDLLRALVSQSEARRRSETSARPGAKS